VEATQPTLALVQGQGQQGRTCPTLTINVRVLVAREKGFKVVTKTVASRLAVVSRPAIALVSFFLVQSAIQKQINHTQRSSQPGRNLALA
jgi:hypothetical protein